ncbi:alpha/beta-hydrolase [Cristinia sonorae]|uniref:Alpha/beta-hydrolase n=1 Tax=Cristinia sonorae TaxID=1940300 RepID=A0A8K0UQ67_9AGAR|nr:alpha/beta-hydrolase [Cristinia sonorae]
MTAVRHFTHEPIQLPSGQILEASLSVPPERLSVTPARKLAVCLHPWSWLGGRMDDPVLQTVKKPLLERGYYVLRYNSRGVGKSSGWPSLTGTSEAQDLQDLVQWALQAIEGVQHVLIFGYSHGSLITSLFPLLPSPLKTSHILLSYPLGPRSWLTAFRGKYYTDTLNALLHDPNANILVVYGDQDEFTGAGSYDTWVDGLEEEAHGEGRGTLRVERVDGATHFWTDANGAREQMVEIVTGWVP